jgi:hypothetical protein
MSEEFEQQNWESKLNPQRLKPAIFLATYGAA